MQESRTTPHEIGLELVKQLMSAKQPCKFSDELWQTALKLLNMRWQVDISQLTNLPFNITGCMNCGDPKGHGGLMCPGLISTGMPT